MGLIDRQMTPEQEVASTEDRSLYLSDAPEQQDSIQRLDPLVEFVMDRYTRSRVRRESSDELRWLESYRNYRGLYGPDVQFTEREKSRLFIKVTKTKVLAAYAQVVDVLFSGGKFPIGVEPTPKTIGRTADAVYFDPADKTQGEQSTSATLVRPELGPLRKMLDRVKDVLQDGFGKTPTSATFEPNKEAARKMEKKIHDQLEESNAGMHLRYAAFELCLFGHCVLKGPFVKDKEYPQWDDKGTYTPIKKTMPGVTSVSIWNFFPDPDAKNIEECYGVVERHKMNRSQLRMLKKRPHFRSEAIDNAIAYGPNYVRQTWEEILDDGASTVTNESYEVLEYWGSIEADLIDETELEIPKEYKADEYQVNIWVCNNQIIRLILNPFTPARIPYHAAPYELNPYSFFGIGVAENMSDTQMLMNGTMRMAVDNLALAGNLIIEVDETNLVPGQSMDIFPGKVFRRQGGAPGQAVFGTKFPSVSQELLQMYDKARQLTDESTSMPSYAHGGTGVTGMGRTASGMSMLMGAAALTTKATIRNLDDYVLSPLGKALFAFNMQFDYDPETNGDLEVVARGTESLMRNEIRSQKLLQFLQLTANPMDAPYVKRDYILRELATSLDLEYEKVVNDPREAAIQAHLIKQMNDTMGVQGGPQQPGSPPGMNLNDPTGTGGGNIQPGMAPTPGAQGFTGNNMGGPQPAQPSTGV